MSDDGNFMTRKRKPGRPPGAKNKPVAAPVEEVKAAPVVPRSVQIANEYEKAKRIKIQSLIDQLEKK